MRRLLFLALLAACGGSSSQDAEISNQPIQRVLVHAYAGSIEVSTHDSPSAILDADTSEPNDLEEFMIFKVVDGVLNVRPVDTALDWEMSIELTLPELTELELDARNANVQVEGSYKALDLKTTVGDLDVHVDRVGSGSIGSTKGRIAFSMQQATLSGSLSCSSMSGNVTATLPAAYRGAIVLTSTSGTVSYPDHKDLHLTGGGSNRSALGYAGAPFTDQERATRQAEGMFRATSGSGAVTLNVEDD